MRVPFGIRVLSSASSNHAVVQALADCAASAYFLAIGVLPSSSRLNGCPAVLKPQRFAFRSRLTASGRDNCVTRALRREKAAPVASDGADV